MQALLACFVILHVHGTLKSLSEYNQAIAGEYGAGSRGMCMLQAPSNHGQYNSSTCLYLYTIAFIYIASCVIMLCTII